MQTETVSGPDFTAIVEPPSYDPALEPCFAAQDRHAYICACVCMYAHFDQPLDSN